MLSANDMKAIKPMQEYMNKIKEAEKVKKLLKSISEIRPHLELQGEITTALRKSLILLVDYIEFMVTPAEDDD